MTSARVLDTPFKPASICKAIVDPIFVTRCWKSLNAFSLSWVIVVKAISKLPTNFFDLFVVSSISLKTLFVCSPIESIKGIRVSISALNFLKSN